MKKKKEKKVARSNDSWSKCLYEFIKYPIHHPIHALTFLLLANQVVTTMAQSQSADEVVLIPSLIKNPFDLNSVYAHVSEEMTKALQSNKFQPVNTLIDHYIDLIPDNVFLMEGKFKVLFYSTQEDILRSDVNLPKLADKLLKLDPNNEYALTFKIIQGTGNWRPEDNVHANRLRSLKPKTPVGLFGRGIGCIYLGKKGPDYSLLSEGRMDIENAIKMETDPEMRDFFERLRKIIIDNTESYSYSNNENYPSYFRSDLVEETNYSRILLYVKGGLYFLGSLTAIGGILTKVALFFKLKQDIQQELKRLDTYAENLQQQLNEIHVPLTDGPIWHCDKNILSARTDKFFSKIDLSKTKANTKFQSVQIVTVDPIVLKELWIGKLKKIFKTNYISVSDDNVKIRVDLNIGQTNFGPSLTEMIIQILTNLAKRSPEVKLKVLDDRIRTLETNFHKIIWDQYHSYNNNINNLKADIVRINNFKIDYNGNKIITKRADTILRIINCLENFLLFMGQGETENNNNSFEKDSLINSLISFEANLAILKHKFLKINKAECDWQNLEDIEILEKEYCNLEKMKNDILTILISYKKNYDNINTLMDEIVITTKTLEKQENTLSTNTSNYKKPKKEKLAKKKENETKEDKAARVAKFKATKKLLEKERTAKKQKEEERLRLKEEANQNVKKALQQSENIDKLSNDARYYILEHNLEIMAETLHFKKDPKQYNLVAACSGDVNLTNTLLKEEGYKVIIYYTLLHCIMRSAHSLGQMSLTYQQFNLLEIQPYRVRNGLMHGSCQLGVAQTELLCAAAEEINGKIRGLIPDIRLHGFGSLPKSIKLENKLFSEQMLLVLENEEVDRKFCLQSLDECLNHLMMMSKVVIHLYEKNMTNYIDHCGLLHHAVIGCFCVIGELLNKLSEKDFWLYNQIKEKIISSGFFRVKESESFQTVFQNVRTKVGHHFTDVYKDGKISFKLLPNQEIFKELNPIYIHTMSLHLEKLLLDILLPFIKKNLTETQFFTSKMKIESETFIPQSEQYLRNN